MKILPYYIPFFGAILALIDDEGFLFNSSFYKNLHFYGIGLFHGLVWGIIFAG